MSHQLPLTRIESKDIWTNAFAPGTRATGWIGLCLSAARMHKPLARAGGIDAASMIICKMRTVVGLENGSYRMGVTGMD